MGCDGAGEQRLPEEDQAVPSESFPGLLRRRLPDEPRSGDRRPHVRGKLRNSLDTKFLDIF